jgi:GR25 family glycosyltransferase involved in LPS biosynthesis
MKIDQYFDKVYVLNLHKRPERMKLTQERLAFTEIEYERFGAVDGSVMTRLWETYSLQNSAFKNPNYIGCAVSHLSMYADALEKGYEKILILEDDNLVRSDANDFFSRTIPAIPTDWNLLYLGFIPLSDDCGRWDYGVFGFANQHVAIAKNFWGLYAYGISRNLMEEALNIYKSSFPMELDRFFVSEIQPRGESFGITPQIFAADDGFSDNSHRVETGMLQRSVDSRFANLTDYI